MRPSVARSIRAARRFGGDGFLDANELRIDGLGERLADGAIACVGTDHAPHPLEEKDRSSFKAPSDFPSVDLLLPLTFALHDRSGLSPERCSHSLTAAAAGDFALERKGRLRGYSEQVFLGGDWVFAEGAVIGEPRARSLY